MRAKGDSSNSNDSKSGGNIGGDMLGKVGLANGW